MNIVVTGGAGFIGSHLSERLVAAGHRVYVVDDLSNGRMEYLSSLLNHPHFSFIHDTVLNRKLMTGLIGKCDLIYHLAAVLGVKNTVEAPIKVIEGSIDGTRIILEAAFRYGRKVVFASTSEVYGKNEHLPFHENSDRVLGPPSVHRWCYATAKAIDEHLCFGYAEQGLPVTVLRYFNTYGPRQTSSQYGGVVPRFIKAALEGSPLEVYGDGTQTRCFTFVNDTVEGTLAAMKASANGLAFNLGTEHPVSIHWLAQMIKQLTGSASPIALVPYEQAYGRGFEDMPARIPSIGRAGQLLGFSPSVSLEEGLRRTIEWYRHNS